MAALRGMKDTPKRDQVTFQCNKDIDYSFKTVERLIKVAYSEVGKINPFDTGYKDAIGVTLPSQRSNATENELLRQALLNNSVAIPALL